MEEVYNIQGVLGARTEVRSKLNKFFEHHMPSSKAKPDSDRVVSGRARLAAIVDTVRQSPSSTTSNNNNNNSSSGSGSRQKSRKNSRWSPEMRPKVSRRDASCDSDVVNFAERRPGVVTSRARIGRD